MRNAFLWLVAMLFFQACQAQSTPDELLLGEQALTAGNLGQAIQYFNAVLRKRPQEERAFVLRGKAKYQQQDYQGALHDAQQVLAINPQQFTPNDYNALWDLGIIHNNLRQFAQARCYLTQAKLADSTDLRLYENIGYSFLQEQNYAAALAEFKHAIRISPTSKTSFYGVGKSHLMLGHYAAAIQAYDQAITLDPTYGTAYENRAAAKYQLQDLSGCCADLQRCRELGLEQVASFQKKVCR